MNKEQTIKFCEESAHGGEWLNAKSDWVLSEYGEFMKLGKYPYLDEVCQFIVERASLPCQSEHHKIKQPNEDNLHGLVYQASKDYRENKMREAGWLRASEDLLESHVGQFIEKYAEGIFGNSIVKLKVVKAENGRFALMKPRARTKGYWVMIGHDYVRKAA